MVTRVTKQKIFDPLYLFETVRDEPIPHKNFTVLGQGSHEIPEGSARSLPSLVSDVGTNTLGNRRIKCFFKLCCNTVTILPHKAIFQTKIE